MDTQQTGRRRRGHILVGLTLLVTALFVAPTPSANADPVSGITCTLGSFDALFKPGITLQPQDIQADLEHLYTNCVSLAEPDIGSGIANYNVGLQDFTCLSLAEPLFDISYTIEWNTQEESEVVVDLVVIGSVITFTGRVTGGDVFVGKTFTASLQSLTLDVPRCLTPEGLTAVTGLFIHVDIT